MEICEPILTKQLQGCAASLFKRMRDLQNAGFAERGAEDLQADREFAVNFAAGNGDSRDARE